MSSSCLVSLVAGQSVAGQVPWEVTADALGGLGAVRAACGALAGYLDQVVDHRSRQGLRHELGYVLAVVVAATACAGHDEVAALAQWAADAPEWVLAELGARPDPLTGTISAPSESTLRRVLTKVDAADLRRLTAQWVVASAEASPARESERLAGVAIDGKSVRGPAAPGGHPRPHLLAAVTHNGSIVLAQRQIPDKGSEISELTTLVAELDLTGKVVTIDALHTQRATAEHLVSVNGADYIMTIKANQPGLLTAAQHALSGPAAEFTEYTEPDRGHGRTEKRIVRTTPVTTAMPIEFPHAAQLFRVLRYTGDLEGQRRSQEVAHCVTSLTPDKATAQDLATLLREHWGAIENKLHWVRDTTFHEDISTLRAGTAPQAMAIIRNTLIAAFRLTGWHNLKQARRYFSHAIHRCVDLITKPIKTVKTQT